MIEFITGVPGSGKTYKAVVTIFNNFSSSKNAKRDLKKEYINCYTNINEFKFDALNDVIPLDFDDLKLKLKELHKLYKDKETDEVLIEKSKEFNIHKTFFVIDECHNYFDVNDPTLIWWLSYHRHLYHDIILLTQNLSLVYTKYKSFSEYFYQAKPTTVVLNRQYLVYDSFISARLSQNSKSGRTKLKKQEEIFDLYQSGDSVYNQNVVLKFLVISLVLLAIVITALVLFVNYKQQDAKEQNQKHSIDSPKLHDSPQKKAAAPSMQNPINSIDYESSIFLTLYCNKTYCFNNQFSISEDVFNHFIKNKEILIIKQKYKSLHVKYFDIYMSKDLFNFLKGVTHNESTFNSGDSIPNLFGK